VPLEAMTVGTPVVASGRGGSGEYLRDGENCLLFDVDSGAPGLAAAVERLAADEELRARLRAGGFETSARIGEDAWFEAVERLLGEAAGT
jgi:glycosyltransferase involved in cell wall biosynthesis